MKKNNLTAVQWLIENAKGFHTSESSKAMQEQALQMEREQIEEAYSDGRSDEYFNSFDDGAKYYTKTFKP